MHERRIVLDSAAACVGVLRDNSHEFVVRVGWLFVWSYAAIDFDRCPFRYRVDRDAAVNGADANARSAAERMTRPVFLKVGVLPFDGPDDLCHAVDRVDARFGTRGVGRSADRVATP